MKKWEMELCDTIKSLLVANDHNSYRYIANKGTLPIRAGSRFFEAYADAIGNEKQTVIITPIKKIPAVTL